MNWLEPQIVTRAKNDVEQTEQAYAKLAASVTGPTGEPKFTSSDVAQEDAAVRACLKYLRVEAGKAPESIKDFHERVEWLCRPSGTMHRTVRLDKGWQKNAFGPMVGTLEDGSTVALLPRGTVGYYYLEPFTGRKMGVSNKMAAKILPEALLFYKPLPQKALTIRDLAAFIATIFTRGDYLLTVAAAAAATLIGLVPAWANNVAFGIVVPSEQVGLVLPIGCLLLGAMISATIIGACRNLVMARVSTKLNVITEAATFGRIMALPTSFFKNHSSGDIANRVSTVTILANTLVSMMLGSGLSTLLSFAYVFQIGAFAPTLTLPAFIIVVIQMIVSAIATIAPLRYERAAMEENSKLSGTVTTLLNGIQKIKLAGAEDRAFAKWADGYAKYAAYAYNRPRSVIALPTLITVVSLFGTIAIYYVAGQTHVKMADYMSFNVAFGAVTGAFLTLSQSINQFATINPMFDLVRPIVEAEPEIAEDKASVTSLSGDLEIAGLSFKYSDSAPLVLKDISFRVRSGEYVGIVGKSGSGKSTLLRLLLGFEKPTRGTIFYGRYDVRKVDLKSLRQHIGVVMQDGKLFQGDIFSNITVASPASTLDDAWHAAELAGVAEDIRKMPMGMQTILTQGGGGVSGGQRQRLMIARAICGNKKILMFDEATSALDNKTQKHVSESLDSLNCTRIVIAHRLSTIQHCDRILVVDDGKIAEEGTYDELIEHNGLFAQLVARQRLDA